MPLPKPEKGEKEKDFISRCMSNENMKSEFSDNDQRLAICYTQFEKKESKMCWTDFKEKIGLFKEFVNEQEELNLIPPKAAQENAKKALKWKEKYKDEVKAGTRTGWIRANQLAKGVKLSKDIVQRMASFNRHRKNSKIKSEYKDTPWKDNGYVAWLIWGGDEGIDWALKMSNKIEKMET